MSAVSARPAARLATLRSGLLRWTATSERAPSRGLRILAVLTAVNTYAIIVMGGIVRTTGSGLGCDAAHDNGWPLCQGRLLPPLEQHAVIEFTHRWLAATASFLLIALVGAAWLRYRHLRRFAIGISAVVALLVAQITLGQITVQYKLSGDIVMAHLANAEALLAVLIWSVLALFPAASPVATTSRALTSARLMTVAAGATFVLVLSGAFVVANGAGYACAGFPICGGAAALDSTQLAAYNLAHRALAGIVGSLVVIGALVAMRAHRGRRDIRVTAIAVIHLVAAQVAAGALVVTLRLPAGLRSLHEALASALWAVTVLLTLRLIDAARAPSMDGRAAVARPWGVAP